MFRYVSIALFCLAPSVAFADGCTALEAAEIEVSAGEQSLTQSTREFLAANDFNSVNLMVDEQRRLLDENWWVGVLCQLQDFWPTGKQDPTHHSPSGGQGSDRPTTSNE